MYLDFLSINVLLQIAGVYSKSCRFISKFIGYMWTEAVSATMDVALLSLFS